MNYIWNEYGGTDSADETPVNAVYPKPESVRLNSPVTAETPEERERLWDLIVQASRG